MKENTVRDSSPPEDKRPLAERLAKPLPVKSGYLKSERETVYWLNGTADEHNDLLTLTTNKRRRQQGFQNAVWGLACDEKGNHLYKGKITLTDFSNSCDKVSTRYYGMLIMGYDLEDDDDDEGQSVFDKEIDEEVKKSKPGSET